LVGYKFAKKVQNVSEGTRNLPPKKCGNGKKVLGWRAKKNHYNYYGDFENYCKFAVDFENIISHGRVR